MASINTDMLETIRSNTKHVSIAKQLAKKQQVISVAEFFERNKQILGFDNLSRAVLTAVKEGVDNSLDACEEANILPEILIKIEKTGRDELKIIVEDNGPGIVKKQIPNIFGRLLYGSRFHAIRQSRGQQGIGISAVVMYGQLSTGKPTLIKSKIEEEDVAHTVELILDTKKNMPEVLKEDVALWDKEHGTRVEITIKGKYTRGKQSALDYLRGVAIVNPHARIVFKEPDGNTMVFERATDKMPKPTIEIKPHPGGIELGMILKMAKATNALKISSLLVSEFSRVSYRVAHEICQMAGIDENLKPKEMTIEQAKAILEAFKTVKIMAPQTDCLSPIGESLVKKGLKNVLGSVKVDFFVPPVTRDPSVYAGNPFQVEVGIVYGGNLPKDQPIQILRFANRVPLLYQQGGCAATLAVENVDWRRYGLEQPGGRGIPIGPAIVLVHVASTKIPFASEAKEAIADIPEIREEIEKALKVCGRKLQIFLNKQVRRTKTKEKFEIVQKVLPKLAEKASRIVSRPLPDLNPVITKIMDVVWIDDKIEFEKGTHKVRIDLYNYTARGKKLNLYAILPVANLNAKSITPKPKEIREDNKIEWELKTIPSVSKAEVYFELNGLEKEDYEENELYVSGIDPVHVIGAEALPGDWNLEGMPQPIEEVGEIAQESEEKETATEEIDDDEIGSKLSKENVEEKIINKWSSNKEGMKDE